MPLQFKRTPDEVRTRLTDRAAEHGFTRLDRFIGAFIEVFSDVYADIYQQLYDLEPQTRIDTATGEFLDSWGIVHDVPREFVSQGKDLSFENVSIVTSNGDPITNYTAGGRPLVIPSGTKILQDNIPILSILDTTVMSGNRVFVRVVAEAGVGAAIPPGIYSLDVTPQALSVLGDDAELGASVVVDAPDLIANVIREIPVEQSTADDNLYRFVVYSKAKANNQFNKDMVNTILINPEIVRFVIKEFGSGSSSYTVYVEPTTGVLNDALRRAVKQTLERMSPYGTVIRVASMIGSYVQMRLDITMSDDILVAERDLLKTEVEDAIQAAINGSRSGTPAVIETFRQAAMGIQGITSARITEVRINGRLIEDPVYSMKDIEFIFANERSVIATIA